MTFGTMNLLDNPFIWAMIKARNPIRANLIEAIVLFSGLPDLRWDYGCSVDLGISAVSIKRD